jgi:hypothetical protein
VDRASIPELSLEEAPSRFAGGPAAWLAVALPLAFGLWSASGASSWSEDGAILRDLGSLPAGAEGAVSSVLTQLATLLPLGSRSLRASLVGVFALALASRCLFELVHDLLERRARFPLNPLFASFASVTWALGADALGAAVRVGGPMPALALVLLGSLLARRAFERSDVRALAATGLVLGATIAERRLAGVALALAIVGLAVLERSRGGQRELWRLLAGLAGGLLGFGSLRLVGLWGAAPSEPVTEHLATGLELLSSARHLPERWASELGSAPLLLACGGIAACAAHPASRRVLWPSVFFMALGLLVPVDSIGSDPEAIGGALFGALSSLGLAVFFPLGVQALVRWSWASPLPFGRPAAVLTVTFATTLVLSHADRAGVDRPPSAGPSVWVDEALVRLPPRSVLLLHDERLALRLLAARELSGARPDVVVLPTGRLSVRSLREPELADPGLRSILRQLWVNGDVDEYALSALADQRPVFVEPSPAWERRLLDHLVPDGMWLRFAPDGVGVSERRAGTLQSRAALRRALELAGGHPGLDVGTQSALSEAAARQAAVLGGLGERALAGRMARAARAIERGDRTAGHEPGAARGRVAARDAPR